MNKLDTGGPARPVVIPAAYPLHGAKVEPSQITWLDECAMRAMCGMAASDHLSAYFDCSKPEYLKRVSEVAYKAARAMLAEKRRLEGGGE